MLHPVQAKGEGRKGAVGAYEFILPQGYPRGPDLQLLILQKLGLFELANKAELQAALARRLRATQELLEAITHNLKRSEQLYRQVMADRQRLLELSEEAQRRLAQLAWLLNEPPEELLQRALALPDDPVDERKLATLVVNLAGALAENRRLRQALGLSEDHDDELVRELDRFYHFYLQRDLMELGAEEASEADGTE